MTYPLVFEFKVCTVTVHDGWIETVFKEDGSRSEFHPPILDMFFQDAARYAGYHNNAWAHGWQHDVLHAFVAEKLGWKHSYSVWYAAHNPSAGNIPTNKWSPRVAYEEHLVVSLQRYINTGLEDHPYYQLREAFPNLQQVAAEALTLLTQGYVNAHSPSRPTSS